MASINCLRTHNIFHRHCFLSLQKHINGPVGYLQPVIGQDLYFSVTKIEISATAKNQNDDGGHG